ncbi:restriction endonuclease [Brachybacterium muris]|uniref:Eco57I restriction-modification methylase domain-containing protein n=1 Tax=Brachybacterium muris TaxID=219301 RepID=UPI00223B9C8C|nr:DNA methyltransferase [Brachybacterium muris]MCT2260190.1 restriction endonuclease [Brachybacterium muris]
MPTSDALVIVDDWISEHYFTSDDKSGTFLARTRDLVADWKKQGEDQPGWQSPLARFTATRSRLISMLLALHDAAEALPEGADVHTRRGAIGDGSVAFADTLRTVLGYTDEDGRPIAWDVERNGPLRRFATRGVEEYPLAMLDALAAGTTEDLVRKDAGHLPADVVLDEGTPDEVRLTSVPAVLSHLALLPDAPEFMLVIAGRTLLLTSADQWAQGRYLAIDLQTVTERGDTKAGGEIQRMLACISAASLAPGADGQVWWSETRQKAVLNAVGVSSDLRDGVRESIEIIANEVVARRRAQGLEPLQDSQAQPLALQSLRYLYRILFLLHAEASPELGMLPVGAPEYENGYSMDRLRELTLKPLTPASANGTHLYHSLKVLFDLVDKGHRTAEVTHREDPEGEATHGAGTLEFENLQADLFLPDRIALIDEVGLGNAALQAVLERLLLSREKRGKDRGFISYVALGINQLGAVYESLMSYTGSFAHGELVEVAKNGNPSDGSWVVPADRIDDELRPHLVMVEDDETGRPNEKRYRNGEFVFRLSGRERQRSASYYSPEVLTRFTVSQGLAELLDPVVENTDDLPEGVETFQDTDFDGNTILRWRTTAAEVLNLTVCEPALGSGAFAIEAVRQLATEYLARRQDELGERIPPEDHALELQKVKAHIALHNVYGVDLNATAVELAEVSLWLDSMAKGLKAPWFGLHLRAGNSLIGARHAVYAGTTVQDQPFTKYIGRPPRAVPVDTSAGEARTRGGVFHFLVPGSGWGTAGDDAEIKKIAPDAANTIRQWAKGMKQERGGTSWAALQRLSDRVEYMWGLATRRLVEAERQSSRSIGVWGTSTPEGGEVGRPEIERSLADPNSAYQRLRLVMDAWCALWFWPVLQEDDVEPPSFTEWIRTLERILGKVSRSEVMRRNIGQGQLASSSSEWAELDSLEAMFSMERAENVDRVLSDTPWLRRTREIASEQRFFHWELEFAPVFARAGGFDLQVGNPPWVRPTLDLDALLGEHDPWWMLTHKPSESVKKARRLDTLERDGAAESVLVGSRDVAALAEFVGSAGNYPECAGTQPDLYRCFMVQVWNHASERGISTLIHPPSHFTDARAYPLRRATYARLRRQWRFVNEMQLFHEIHHLVEYSINVYGGPSTVDFLSAVALYHPETVEASLRHNGDGPEPGFKDDNDAWDLRPHQERIQRITRRELKVWHRLMEAGSSEIPVEATRTVSTVNSSAAAALSILVEAARIGDLRPQFSAGWHESGGRRDGYFESKWGAPESWNGVILQGPYFHVGNPFYASRGRLMKSNRDYVSTDLETLAADALPVTEYRPIHETRDDGSIDTSRYDQAYGRWPTEWDSGGNVVESVPIRSQYRVMWRKMAATTGERTFITAIYPPGPAHIDGVCSFGFPQAGPRVVTGVAASMSSLIADFYIRTTAGANIRQPEAERIPSLDLDHPLADAAILRILRLNCLTDAYADLWRDCFDPSFVQDSWTGGRERTNRPALGDVGPEWSASTPLRMDEDRRQALVEIDAIMAVVTGIDIEDLVTLYRTQFGVLAQYDRGGGKRAYIFDDDGRIIPSAVRTVWNKASRPETGLPVEDRTYTNDSGRTITAPEPFRILDRAQDLRTAYAAFVGRM